jgi:hypothetical protein
MNIFPTSNSAAASAAALDDKRLVRQASEVPIMLCSVNALDGIPSPYKANHQPGHKLVVWLRAEPVNWVWTYVYAAECMALYRARYRRDIACTAALGEALAQRLIYFEARGWSLPKVFLPADVPNPFCNAASNKSLGLDFTRVQDVHSAYRQYLLARWALAKTPPTWRDGPPAWLHGDG